MKLAGGIVLLFLIGLAAGWQTNVACGPDAPCTLDIPLVLPHAICNTADSTSLCARIDILESIVATLQTQVAALQTAVATLSLHSPPPPPVIVPSSPPPPPPPPPPASLCSLYPPGALMLSFNGTGGCPHGFIEATNCHDRMLSVSSGSLTPGNGYPALTVSIGSLASTNIPLISATSPASAIYGVTANKPTLTSLGAYGAVPVPPTVAALFCQRTTVPC
jgi:hypothetical protein